MITINNKKGGDGNESQCFGSYALTLQDDESAVMSLPVNFGHVLVAEAGLTTHGLAWVRGSAAAKYFGGASFAVMSNTILTGATGVDGQLTISSNAGNFYIENRLGSALTFSITFLGIASYRI